jgi:O-antigen/teichoic acid export membrane protein
VLLTNAASLSGTSAITLPLGFAFWWLAAHRFPADSVGLASAAVSAMMLLSTVSVLGFGTLLIAELARDRQDRVAVVVTSLLVVAAAGFCAGCAFALVAASFVAHLRPLGGNPLVVVLFGLGVSAATIAQVLDQALVGVLRGGLQFFRNLVFGIAKLGVLLPAALFAFRSGMTIYSSWIVGLGISFVAVAIVLRRDGAWPASWRLDWRAVAALRRSAGWHHALNLSLAGPQFALPLIATAVLSPRQGAYFYIAWIIGTIPSMVPGALSTVLYAVGAAAPGILGVRVRQTMMYSLAAVVFLGLPIVVLAPWLLGLFGSAYRTAATTPLRVIVLAGLPLIVRSHFVAVSRSRGNLGQAVSFVSITAVLEVTAAAVGANEGGLTGLAFGLALVLCLEAVVMARPLLTLRHSPDMADAVRPESDAERVPLEAISSPHAAPPAIPQAFSKAHRSLNELQQDLSQVRRQLASLGR